MTNLLRLAPLTLDLALSLAPLRNKSQVQEHLRNPGTVNEYDQRTWCEHLTKHHNNVRMFVVEKPVTQWKLIGCAGLTTIDWQNRHAELSVYTVPPTYEIEAAHLILYHAFSTLGLHRVEAETLTNRRYILCEELGFTCEGSRRHAYWRAGEFIDSTQWGLLAVDYSPTEPEAA